MTVLLSMTVFNIGIRSIVMVRSPAGHLEPRQCLPMVLLMDLLQTLVREVGVDLRRCDARVTEHFLHRANVGAVLQELCCERVPECVGGYLLHDASHRRDIPYDPLDSLGLQTALFSVQCLRHGAIRITDEERNPVIVPTIEIILHVFGCEIRDEDDACFSALSDDAEFATLQVHIFTIEVTDLAYTEPCGVEEVEEGEVAESITFRDLDDVEHRGELIPREYFYLSAWDFRQFDLLGRDRFDVVLLQVLEHRS